MMKERKSILILTLMMALALGLLSACKVPLDGDDPQATTPSETTTTQPAETTQEPTPVPTQTQEPEATEPDLSSEPPSEENPVIALTFDDGPNLHGTEELLDLLKDEGVTATFFVLGSQVDAGREAIVRRTHEEGHEVANHSYSHPIFTDQDEATIREELESTQALIQSATGEAATLMRPPTGAYDERVQQISREMDLAIVNWSWQSTPQDWNHHEDPEFISEFVVEHAENGHIVLLHDTNEGTLAAMPEMIAGLKARGFRFMSVSEMFAATGSDELQPGSVYTHLGPPLED